jgi:hypothetical protein|tara:strand:+ start:1082 stop:1570 length:489 start_codon:yes stop_codon:yes gene_type:complete
MITNYLSPISFKVIVDRLPSVEFYTQRVNLPQLSMVAPQQASPIHNIFQTPDRIDYSDLDLSFIVDENMTNYEEILRWMEGMGTPQSSNQRAALVSSKHGERSDISIIIESSSRNSNLNFTFTECFPTSLSGVALDVTNSDIIYPECTVTFRYTNMVFEKIS